VFASLLEEHDLEDKYIACVTSIVTYKYLSSLVCSKLATCHHQSSFIPKEYLKCIVLACDNVTCLHNEMTTFIYNYLYSITNNQCHDAHSMWKYMYRNISYK